MAYRVGGAPTPQGMTQLANTSTGVDPTGSTHVFSLERCGRRRSIADPLFAGLSRGGAVVVLLMLAALVCVLTNAAIPSMRAFGFSFLASTEWRPNDIEQPKIGADGKVVIEDAEVLTETLKPSFGAMPVIWGTTVSSILALLVAVPMSLGAALFLVRVAPRWLAQPVSFLSEFLAAIPSIAYGIWGLFVLAPFLQRHVEPQLNNLFARVPAFGALHFAGMPSGRDMLCGGALLGIMIVPIITAVSRDVLRAVPRAQIEGTLALGATWWQSAAEMLKFSRSGLFGGVMLGLARAAGETMAVTMVIGNNSQIRLSPLAPAQTMSSLLANEFAEAGGELHRSALIEVALILLVMSLLFNVIARYLVVGTGPRSASAH
jgi:phosphate transport system permease protein